jgi:hypothetical protein
MNSTIFKGFWSECQQLITNYYAKENDNAEEGIIGDYQYLLIHNVITIQM